MDEGVHRHAILGQSRQAFMFLCECITEIYQHAFERFRCVGFINAMMKMNFNLTKTFSLEGGKLVKQRFVILLSRIKVSVLKGVPSWSRTAAPIFRACSHQ
jgi:hypothetical protein